MIGDVALVAAAAVFILLAFWEAGYFRKGLHRGKYRFRMLWPHGVFLRGQHCGEYVEKPEWHLPNKWTSIRDAPAVGHKVPVVGSVMIRDYIPEDDHGRFGDLDIDRSDNAPVWPFLPDGPNRDNEGKE